MTSPLKVPILLPRSAVPGRRPGDGHFRALLAGEWFLNLADGVACWLDAGGAIETTPLRDLATHADVAAAVSAAVAAIQAGAPGALNTLKELADALGDDANYAATVTAALGNRLRVDAAQSLTSGQRAQGRGNLGAAEAGDNASITSLTGLNAAGITALLRALGFAGVAAGQTPYDTGNLTAAQIAAILGYTPGRVASAFSFVGSNAPSGQSGLAVAPSAPQNASYFCYGDFACAGSTIHATGEITIYNNASSVVSLQCYLGLLDLNTGSFVGFSPYRYVQLAGSGGQGWEVLSVTGAFNVTPGHSYRIHFFAYNDSPANPNNFNWVQPAINGTCR